MADQERPQRPIPDHITLTEKDACADCEHQMYDHQGGECRVRRSNGVMCECKGFRFRDEGRVQ